MIARVATSAPAISIASATKLVMLLIVSTKLVIIPAVVLIV